MPVLPLEPVPLELGNAKGAEEHAGILLAADRGGGARGAWGGVGPFYYVPPLDLCPPTSRGK